MSFTSDYLKLRKKRTNQDFAVANDSTEVKQDLNDIAPVFTANRNDVVFGINTRLANSTVASQQGGKGEDKWFKKSGAFDDGYDFGDITKTVAATAGDAIINVTKGVNATAEGIADLILHGVSAVSKKVGADNVAEKTKNFANVNFTEYGLGGLEHDFLDDYSIIGGKGDAIPNAIGQIATIIATGGAAGAAGATGAGVTAATTGLMGLSSMGGGISEAYQGGATDGEAWTYGAIKGAVDAGTELIFGGLGKGVNALGVSRGLTSLDDVFAKKLSSKISNQFFSNLTEYGVKASAEGLEEVLAGLGTAVAKKLTYMSDEELGQLVKDENLLDQFIVGTVASGMAQGGDLISSNVQGRDFITDLSKNEEAVVKAEYESRIEEAEADGTKLTNKQKNKIYDQVIEELKKGYISTDRIESVLGGESYKTYQDTIKSEEAAIEELKGLYKGDELKAAIDDIINNSKRGELKTKLSEDVRNSLTQQRGKRTITDSYLMESYNESARRGQAYNADVSQYDETARATIQKAIDSGILNDTRRTHEFVDMIAKISADKGVSFDFTNNEKLKGTSFAVDGRTVNGFVTDDGVTLNIQSSKALNSIVGHEITHVLEGTDLYETLKESIFDYAAAKGTNNSKFENEYAERLYNARQLYKDIEGYKGVEGFNKIKNEVVADLVGDYLFTDPDFINHLSTKNRNVFQKLYDEVKYLCKIATAGSKEARELEKVKRAFDKAYRTNSKTDSDTKYSLSDSDGKKLTKEQSEYFKDSKMRDENGNLKVMYHGSQDAGFHTFDANMADDDTSFFFVDRNDVAASYSGTTETYEARTIRTAEDMNNFIEEIGVEGYEVVEKDGKFTLLYEGGRVAGSNTAQGIYDEFCWYEGVGDGDANYKVYLNLKNPLEVDAKGRPWNKIDAEFSQEVYDKYQSLTAEEKAALTDLAEWEDFRLFNSEIQEAKDNELASAYAKMGEDCNIYDLFSVAADNFSEDSMRENSRKYLKTRDYAQRAKEQGYDGVIFKNLIDNGGYSNGSEGASTVAIAFESNQIKSVANEKPTGNADIRYSLSNPQTDKTYLAAVERGDTDTAQKIVEDVAKQSGYSIRAYHGTRRGDRVGNVFLPERATSGPMAFFTDNKEIAEGYAKSKQDTSMAYDPDFDRYETQFRIKTKYNDMPLYRAWGFLPFDARNRITKKAGQLHENWDGDYELILDPDTNEANGGFQWQLKEARGNAIQALIEQWLNSGTLFNEESRFLDVLEMTGVTEEFKKIGMDSLYFKDPSARHEKVYDTYLKITHPFDTANVTEKFADDLEAWYEEQDQSKYVRETADSDLWDKNNIDAYDFVERVRRDIENGTTHAWTSIPDSVTDYLKHLGYDGIKDVGGKNGGYGHTVWIPFSSEQIKSAEAVTYDDNGNVIPLSDRFNPEKADIRYSLSPEGETPKRNGKYHVFGKDIALEKAPMQEDISPVVEDISETETTTDNTAPIAEVAEEKPITQTEQKVAAKKHKPTRAALANFTKKSKYSGGFNFQGAYIADGKQYLSDGNFIAEFDSIDKSIPHNKEIPIKKLQNILNGAVDGQATEKYSIDFDKIVEINNANKGNKVIVSVGGTPFDSKYIEAVMRTIPNTTFALSDYRGGIKTLVAVGDNGRAMLMPVRAGDNFTATYEAQEIKPITEDFAPSTAEYTNAPYLDELYREQADLENKIRVAMEANDPNAETLITQYTDLLAKIEQTEAEEKAMQREALNSLDDKDAPPEMEAPYYGETEETAPIDPFEDKDIKEVGNRKVKAYMYENPEVKPFFQGEAGVMLGELRDSVKGERFYTEVKGGVPGEYGSDSYGIWTGTTRHTTPDIAYLLDVLHYSYDQIENGLKAIIEDNGAENNACSKRIEFLLNDRLLNGYQDFTLGFEVPPDQDYINLLKEKQITEYSEEAKKHFFENADDYAPMTEEDIAPIAPIAESGAEAVSIDAPIAEQYEAIKPKRERKTSTEPKLKRVSTSESSGGKQRKWIGTSTESEAVDGKIFAEDLDQKAIHYQPISNKTTLGKANAKLDGMGYESSVAYFNSQFANKKVSLEDVALGERLIQEAIKRGDTKTAGELIQNVAILGTELGQKVQALSMIKRLTPEGQLRMLQKTVERGKTKGDKAYEGVEITQDMIDHILKIYGKDGTYDQAKLNEAVEDVKKQIADQMNVSKMDKLNAWRYLSMLGNPKTHIRNLVSNVAMRGTVAVKNAVARTIETIAPIENRTKTWRSATEEVKAFATQTTAEMKDILSDGGKYSEDASIKAKRQIFKNKVLNGVYEFNTDMLTKEDWWFSRPAFKNALSEYLTANGIRTKQDIEGHPEIVEKAKQYATEQAQIATFRQYSWLSNKINEIERKNVATQIAVGSVLPFKKTPVNIAKTALNYSPLGFAKTLTYDATQVKNGKMEASELVDHLAQNMTGTALTLVGYMLASAGFINGAGDDDKEGEYDYQLGEQAYSINIGDATFSLSWLSPIAMPLFVGANAYEQLVEGKEWNGDVVIETLAQTLDPLSEMSFLSSLDTVLSSYDSGIEKFAGMAQSAAQNYVTQFVPTLSSQVAQVFDDTKRSTKVGADSDFKFVDETINKLKYKIPVLRNTLEPTTDIWGNEVEQTEDFITRAVEAFIAPYAKKEDITTGIDEEIKALYRETGDTGLIPSIPNNYINYDGVKYEMSEKEYTDYKKLYGQSAYELMSKLFDTDTYQNATSEERADMVNKVYDYARDEAKREYFAKYGLDFTNATSEGKEYYKENSIRGAIENDMTPDEYEFSTEDPEKYEFLNENGVSYDDYKNGSEEFKEAYSWAYNNPEKFTLSKAIASDVVTYRKYASELYDIKADKDENGKSINGSRKEKVIEYINNLDADYGEKIILLKNEYNADDTYNEEIVEYLNSREDISYEEMITILKELGFTVSNDGTTVTW